MRNGWVWGRAPATIANVGPGFDVFALAIHGPRDEVAIRPAEEDSPAVEGVDAEGIPTKFSENTAGIVIDALRAATGISQPLRVRVRKGVPSSRGLGSSAASCAGAALAFLKAFPASSSLGAEGFIHAAVAGEAAVSGRHYDNVAAALLGGFVTVASTQPLILQRGTVSSRVAQAIAGAAANAMCGAFEALGTHATPLVTTADNSVPLGAVVAKAGPRFSIIAA